MPLLNIPNRITSKLIDSTDAPFGLLQENGCLVTKSYLQAIAEGYVSGHSPWVLNGYNGALSNVSEDLWSIGGAYVFPTVAQQMEVVSDSASDTNGGVGVNTLRIDYLDSSFVEKSTTVIMSGTTAVATSVSDIFRVNYMSSQTVGTTGFSVGNIDIRHLSDTPIYGRILAGQNLQKDFIYTVPFGKTLYITNVLLSAAGNVANRPVRFSTRATWDKFSQSIKTFFYDYTDVIVLDGSIDLVLEFPTKFTTGVDIKISAISPDGATYGAVVCRGWLETV